MGVGWFMFDSVCALSSSPHRTFQALPPVWVLKALKALKAVFSWSWKPSFPGPGSRLFLRPPCLFFCIRTLIPCSMYALINDHGLLSTGNRAGRWRERKGGKAAARGLLGAATQDKLDVNGLLWHATRELEA